MALKVGVRNEVRMTAPHGGRSIHEGDILVLEADVATLPTAFTVFGIKLDGQDSSSDEDGTEEAKFTKNKKTSKAKNDDAAEGDRKRDEDIVLRELAVRPTSSLVMRSASNLYLRARYGLNLLAVSRGLCRLQKRAMCWRGFWWTPSRRAMPSLPPRRPSAP